MAVAPPKEPAQAQYPLFDYLRLILASLVVLSHAHVISFGSVAVSGFLALSGFLVTGSLERSKTIGAYAGKRARRILPALMASFLLVLILFGPSELGRTLIYYLSFGFYGDSVNRALWSLPFEEAFYVLLAILFVTNRLKNQLTIGIGLACGLILCCLGSKFGFDDHNQIHRALPLVWALFIGVAFSAREESRRSDPLLGTAMVALGVCLFLSKHDLGLAGLLIAPGVLLLGTSMTRLPRIPFDLSYGFYIYHMPILAFASAVHAPVSLALLVLVAFAAASWFLIESPVLRAGRSKPSPPSTDRSRAGADPSPEPIAS